MNQREYDDPIDALKAELANVSPSPEFQSRVRQRIAGELDLLRDELAAVAPSPEFAVRVRQGIDVAAETRKASWLSGWRWVVPVAVAAGAIAVIVMTRSGDTSEQVTVQASVPAPAAIQTPNPIVPPQAPTPAATVEIQRPTSPRRSKNAPVVAKAVVADADPMLEVITNQPAILRAMWARLPRDSSAGLLTPALIEEAIDITVAPVEVNPVVVKWLVEPPVTSGVLPFIRRVAADMAERSAK